jgi:hypothetical protein
MAMVAEVWIYTRRLGLLSRAGHDLKLYVGDIALEVSGRTLSADIDPTQIMVVAAMRGGQADAQCLSVRDRDAIHRSLQQAVLDSRRFPRIRFEGCHREDGLHGTLTLCGRPRPVSLPWAARADRWIAEGELDHRDFGIRPFSAMMGMLQVDPAVRLRVGLPALG